MDKRVRKRYELESLSLIVLVRISRVRGSINWNNNSVEVMGFGTLPILSLLRKHVCDICDLFLIYQPGEHESWVCYQITVLVYMLKGCCHIKDNQKFRPFPWLIPENTYNRDLFLLKETMCGSMLWQISFYYTKLASPPHFCMDGWNNIIAKLMEI